jgi:hypothetical protein
VTSFNRFAVGRQSSFYALLIDCEEAFGGGAGLAIALVTAPSDFCIASSARIDPARVLNEYRQRRFWWLTFRGITQRACPFADHLVVDSIATRTANDGSEGVSVSVDGQMSKVKRGPQ